MSRRTRTVIPLVAMAVVLLGVFGLVWNGFRVQDEKIQQLREDRDALVLQVRGLEMIAGEDGRFIQLTRELIRIAGDKLGIYLPDVAHKVFELEERFRNDNLPVDLILALVEVESAFDPRATSTYTDSSGTEKPLAYGVTQVIRSTARPYLADLGYEWTPEVLYEPKLSMEVGFRHLVVLHRQNVAEGLEDPDDWQWSIMMYFWGERYIKEAMSVPSNRRKETPAWGYWKRVNDARLRWREKGF